jgi:hypothetical protein
MKPTFGEKIRLPNNDITPTLWNNIFLHGDIPYLKNPDGTYQQIYSGLGLLT